jgi:hypothetical protein
LELAIPRGGAGGRRDGARLPTAEREPDRQDGLSQKFTPAQKVLLRILRFSL